MTLSIQGTIPMHPHPLLIQIMNIYSDNSRYKSRSVLIIHMSLEELNKHWKKNPYLSHNLPLTTMKSGVMDIYHNDPYTYIYDS